ncbi:MAG: hypothetical protein ACK5NY_05090 [Burkholderiaceae bacterium]|jgi:hypothetical protein
MNPNRPAYHIIKSFVLKRSPDGTLFELPTRFVEQFESLCEKHSAADAQRRFSKYIVH